MADLATLTASGWLARDMSQREDDGAAKVANARFDAGNNQVLDTREVAPVGSAYRVTSDGQVITGPCIVFGFVATAGTSPTIAMYDGTSASGTLIYGGATAETLGAPKTMPCAIECATGLYIDVGGTTPAFTVYAKP